jgi:hypothetical protein
MPMSPNCWNSVAFGSGFLMARNYAPKPQLRYIQTGWNSGQTSRGSGSWRGVPVCRWILPAVVAAVSVSAMSYSFNLNSDRGVFVGDMPKRSRTPKPDELQSAFDTLQPLIKRTEATGKDQ